MLFSNIAILDENGCYQDGFFVGTQGKRITYVGKTAPLGDYGEIYKGENKLLIPGFVNAHAHSPMTLLRGYAENLALDDWLHQKVFPFEAKMTGEDMYAGTLLAIAEMLRFGTVSCTDMYLNGEAVGRAFLESGFKANICQSVTCFDGSSLEMLPMYQDAMRTWRDFHQAGDGRILVDLGIHAEYTSTPKVVTQVAQKAGELGLRIHLHLSETKAEQEGCKQRHGLTPAAYFAKLGVLDHPVNAAHCVWLEGDDFALLREKGVTVAANPVSNLKLASGFCNVPKLLQMGVNVAIGTDGAASNNSLDMLEEMKFFATVYKAAFSDPMAVSPAQAIYAATRAGALGQGRTDCGLIREGYCADLAVLDTDQPHWYPRHNGTYDLVYAAKGSDVCLTMVDGQVLYRDGEYPTIDIEKVKSQAAQAAKRIAAGLAG